MRSYNIAQLALLVSCVHCYADYCSEINVHTDKAYAVKHGIIQEAFDGSSRPLYVPIDQTRSELYIKSPKPMSGKIMAETSDSNLVIKFNEYEEDL